MSAGHGGQVVVSEATARLLDSRADLNDLGEHRLKDLSAPERLYQVGAGAFPPLKTLYRTNLPIVATPLVGRERELDEAGALLRAHRLLTLTGPGGSGKTRLAVHLGANASEDFPDGVFWVPLQAVRDPAIVERTIAAAVGADDGLIHYVGSKRMLVLLDNFEQIVDAAPTVSALLTATPNIKVLVTSREPLHVAQERCYPVEPLELDDAESLFNERACAVVPTYQPTAETAKICERLDRLPLAIELAAARVTLLDPADLLARLDERLPLLSSRSRDAPARQRTLRATIEWSYQLLDPAEQQLFRRIAVFRGSFSIDAAHAVCAADIDTTESLVVKNLLRRRWGTGRLLMLDTIREYAWQQLDESEERHEVHRRHAEHFLGIAASTNLTSQKMIEGEPQHELALLEQDNFRGALTWAINAREFALGLALATELEQFWVQNDPAEGARWFRALLDDPDAASVDPDLRAHALRSRGSSTFIAGDPADAERAWEQSLELFDQLGDERGRAVLLHRLGISAMVRGDLDQARERLEASHAIHLRNPDTAARSWGLAQTTGTLGGVARDAGDDARAAELFRESAQLAEDAGGPWWKGGMLAELAALALRNGRTDAAAAFAAESLTLADQLRDRPGRVFGVGLLAIVAAERGELERAGRLWGAIEDERAFAPVGGWQRHRDACEALIRQYANDEFERGRAAGRELELDQAVEEALAAP